MEYHNHIAHFLPKFHCHKLKIFLGKQLLEHSLSEDMQIQAVTRNV